MNKWYSYWHLLKKHCLLPATTSYCLCTATSLPPWLIPSSLQATVAAHRRAPLGHTCSTIWPWGSPPQPRHQPCTAGPPTPDPQTERKPCSTSRTRGTTCPEPALTGSPRCLKPAAPSRQIIGQISSDWPNSVIIPLPGIGGLGPAVVPSEHPSAGGCGYRINMPASCNRSGRWLDRGGGNEASRVGGDRPEGDMHEWAWVTVRDQHPRPHPMAAAGLSWHGHHTWIMRMRPPGMPLVATQGNTANQQHQVWFGYDPLE